MNIQDLLGAVVQSGGMSSSSLDRIKTSLGGGGVLDSLSGMLGGSSRGTARSGAPGGVLGSILKEAGRAVGGDKNLSIGGLGALAGALLGGGRKSMGGALGGGLMALLGAMAFQALKGSAGSAARVPLGLAAPMTKADEAELERNSQLVLKAMINAAKADGQIDQAEIGRIVGKVGESGADREAQEFLAAEMRKPMDTAALIAAARGKPELAAQIYGASLLAIEVDTPAEKQYLEQLAAGMGLEPETTRRIEQAAGVQRV